MGNVTNRGLAVEKKNMGNQTKTDAVTKGKENWYRQALGDKMNPMSHGISATSFWLAMSVGKFDAPELGASKLQISNHFGIQ
jgi:hypothetical protein